MTCHRITFLGWILFVILAIGFCMATIGRLGALLGWSYPCPPVWHTRVIPYLRSNR